MKDLNQYLRRVCSVNCSILLIVVCCVLTSSHSVAQSLPSGSGSSGSQPSLQSRQQMPSLTDIIESIGYTLTESIRDLFGKGESNLTRWNSNSSPRETVFTFVYQMDAIVLDGLDDYSAVLLTLPEGYTVDSPQVRALKSVFDRLGDIQNADLPGYASLPSDKIKTYEVFPYSIDHVWLWEAIDGGPVGKIVVVQDAVKNGWVFSRETLEGAPKLLESMRSIAPLWGQRSKQDLVKRIFLPMIQRSPWWSWILLGFSICLAVVATLFFRKKILKFGDMLEAKTKPMVGSMTRSIGTALAIILGTVVFVLGSSFVELSPTLSQLHWSFVKIVLLFALVTVVFGATDLVATLTRNHVVKDNHEYGSMTVQIVQRIIRSLVFLFLALFVLENILGFNITALVTGLGIIGLALSLAGKETAQNLFGAVSIFVNRPFVVGDWVEFNDEVGEVAEVRMQATHIRLLSGEMLIVPNMQFISKQVENLGMRKYLRREMNIAIPYGTEPEKVDRALELIREVLESEAITKEGKCNLEEKPPIISFSDFGDYYLNIKVFYWYFIGDTGEELQRNHERGWFTYLEHNTLVNRAILKAFNENDIKFAFPTQTIELEKEDAEAHSANTGE